jgi:hypothetical protein
MIAWMFAFMGLPREACGLVVGPAYRVAANDEPAAPEAA